MRAILFHLLRLYVAVEQSALVKWLKGQTPDVILEPLPRPDDDVPEVHTSPSVFLAADGRSAYTHNGTTLRRVALNEGGELVYIRKPSKRERRAVKRGNRAHA